MKSPASLAFGILALTASGCMRVEMRLGLERGRIQAPTVSSASATPTATPRPVLACGSFATFADGKTPTTFVHITVSGSDQTGNGSTNAPYRTLGKAVSVASPGTSVVLHAGTYAGSNYFNDVRGTVAAPIWIGGAIGEARPVIDGGTEGLKLSRPYAIVLHDLEIRSSGDNGINIDDAGDTANPNAARFVIFRNLSVHDNGLLGGGNSDCIKISGLNDFFVLNSSIYRCDVSVGGQGDGIDGVGCHRGVIANSTFRDNADGGVQFKGGSTDIEILRNQFQNSGKRSLNFGGATGYSFFRPPLSTTVANAQAKNLSARENLIIGGEAAASFVGCVDCSFEQNTVVDTSRWQLRILQEQVSDGTYSFEPASGGRIVNNIFYYLRANQSYQDINLSGGTDLASFVLDSNLWYTHDSPAQSQPLLSGFTGLVFSNIVGLDPLFVSASSLNYRLGAGSPAVRTGRTGTRKDSDLDGVCYGTPPSVGAYEHPQSP